MSDWIDVNERLPDFDEFVLWVNDACNYSVDHIDKDTSPKMWIAMYGITHWMPLPEAPTQNDSGTKRELNGN